MTKLVLGILLLAIGCSATAADISSYESSLAKGTQLLRQEEFEDAADVLKEAIKSLRAEQGDDTLDTVHLLLQLAKANAGLGKKFRSDDYFDDAIELLEQASSEDHADLIIEAFSIRMSADNVLREQPKKSKHLTAIYDIAAEVMGDKDLRTANMATKLGRFLLQRGRQKDAVKYLDQAYTILKNATFIDQDQIGSELLILSGVYVQVDRMETADELLKIAMAIGASTDPLPIVRVAPTYPEDCLIAGVSGEVELEFGVGIRGRVHDVQVTEIRIWQGEDKSDSNDEPCRDGLAQTAIEATSQFRYIPGLENGLPVVSDSVKTMITYGIEF